MVKPKILVFAGSTRKDSYNKKLAKIAGEGARATGADVTFIDLKDYPMPLYDGDFEVENGLSDSVKKFKKILLEHQGLLISSPEYNSSISGVLKNAIDWASRPETPAEIPLVCFNNKVAGIMAASPGALGGLRGLVTVRSLLGNLNVLVIPQQMAIAKAGEAFEADGNLKDAKQQKAIQDIGVRVTNILMKIL